MAGGTVYDIGVYASTRRYLFADKPIEVMATTANSGEGRFSEVEDIPQLGFGTAMRDNDY